MPAPAAGSIPVALSHVCRAVPAATAATGTAATHSQQQHTVSSNDSLGHIIVYALRQHYHGIDRQAGRQAARARQYVGVSLARDRERERRCDYKAHAYPTYSVHLIPVEEFSVCN